MESELNGEEPESRGDLCNINLVPSELFLKFRKDMEGIRLGVNLELYNAPLNDFRAKLVLKPSSRFKFWKFIYEPLQHNVRIFSRKIPVTGFFNLQVGVAHNLQMNATGWKWKLSTCFGGDVIPGFRNKTTLELRPGVGLRFGWRAAYALPEVTGGRALGTGEPLFNLQMGKFHASLDRVEAILTHSDEVDSNTSETADKGQKYPFAR